MRVQTGKAIVCSCWLSGHLSVLKDPDPDYPSRSVKLQVAHLESKPTGPFCVRSQSLSPSFSRTLRQDIQIQPNSQHISRGVTTSILKIAIGVVFKPC